MALTATNLYMNFAGVSSTYTPVGGGTNVVVPIPEVTDVEIDGKSVQKVFYGDNRRFARLIRNTAKTRAITVKGGNVAAFLLIPEDVENTVVATLCDAVNGTSTGAITITAIRALPEARPFKGPNNEYASLDFKYNCSGVVASGGTDDTDPITFAIAP